MFYWFFRTVVFYPLVAWLFGARLTGQEKLPGEGPAILASNHLSAGDTIVLPSMLRRPLTFPAKAELFAGNKGLFSKVVAWFLKRAGQVPLDRSGGRVSVAGLEPVLKVLSEGGMVGIYPEGTRSPDGRLYRGRTGVARIALASGVPVYPVGMFNSQIVRNRIGIPWIRRPRIVIGDPLDFRPYAGLDEDRSVARWVTDEVMTAIQEVTGQDYVDVYGSVVKYGTLSAEEVDSRRLERPGLGTTPPQLPGA